ncbi:hypothetical protein [Macrococcus animalis]|uniref:hypothetical protein n=1 Tax=Macrococcus animalis TaxID=3395467 RepID=UPI0039BEA052
MINFLRSENYKMMKTKGYYIISAICIMLLIMAAYTLNHFGNSGKYFPYYRADFYYNNIIAFGILIIVIGSIINSFLVNNESLRLLKQTVSFGISRSSIFFGKYLISLMYFVILCVISLLVVYICGRIFLPKDKKAFIDLLYAIVNMVPIILGGFSLAHALNISGIKEFLSGIILVAVLLLSSSLFYILSKFNKVFMTLYDYSPKVLLDGILTEYMDHNVQLSIDYWITGIFLTVTSLLVSFYLFNKKDI